MPTRIVASLSGRLSTAMALGLGVIAVVCAVAPRSVWWYGVLLDLVATMVLPALGLGLVALLLPPRRFAGLPLLAALVLGGVTIAATPQSRGPRGPGLAEAAQGFRFRAMTYNLWLRSPQLEASLALIEEVGPDVLALQEVGSESAKLLVGLAALPNVVLTPRDEAGNGDGLLSRYPIRSFVGHDLKPNRGRISEYVVDVEGTPLLVLNVHLSRPPLSPLDFEGWRSNLATRLEQVEFLDQRAAAHEGPVLVLGDMNSPAGGSVHARMIEELGFQEALPRGPWWGGDTYPFRGFPGAVPVWAIDYVYVRGRLEVDRAWVPIGGGSDHLPVVADLRLSAAGTTGRPDSASVSRKD